jgi:hypothetical protein
MKDKNLLNIEIKIMTEELYNNDSILFFSNKKIKEEFDNFIKSFDKEDLIQSCFKQLNNITIWSGEYVTFKMYNLILEILEMYFNDIRIAYLRHYLYRIFEQFHLVFNDNDARELNRYFQKRLIEENLPKEKISRSDIENLSSKIFQDETILTKPFKGWLFEIDKYNEDGIISLLGFSSLIYKTARKQKEKINNDIIEFLIYKAEDVINYIINNDFNPAVYIRFVSLVSAKNNLKIRYNIDNKKWDMEKLLDDYLFEVEHTINNNYHLINKVMIIKLIEDISKIQNYYNYFDINKNLIKLYKKLIKDFEIMDGVDCSSDNLFWGIVDFDFFNVKLDDDNISNDDLFFKEHLYKRDLERWNIFAEILLFKKEYNIKNYKKFLHIKKIKKTISEEWNMFNNEETFKSINSVDFIY